MKGECSSIAEYVIEMALLLGTDGLKINMCIFQAVLHDVSFASECEMLSKKCTLKGLIFILS